MTFEVAGAASVATVLVVDDNEANRALARDTLDDEGYRVVLASGGAEGLREFKSAAPDCVVLDIRMPDMDGFTVCKELRASPEGGAVPILFLTALRDVETFDRALAAGADDFVTKPVRPAELAVRVATALKLSRLGKDLREHYDLLRRQRDDVMRLQLQKERLSAFVVHDLKNPLSALDLHAQFLESEEGLSDDARQSVGFIRSEVRLLTRMVQNLRDVSKADEGTLVAERCEIDPKALIEAVVNELRAAALARNITLTMRVEAFTMLADEDLFRRTLANLVDNAIRHAPPSTVVDVSLVSKGAYAELRVTDAGQGVPAEARERIFDALVRVEADVHPRSGRALGLTFCKLAALAHGGTIWIEDGAPGAVFCVRLPNAS